MAPQEMKERCLLASNAALGRAPRKGKQGPEWIWLTCVHSRIAANSQEAEAAQVFREGWTDEQSGPSMQWNRVRVGLPTRAVIKMGDMEVLYLGEIHHTSVFRKRDMVN